MIKILQNPDHTHTLVEDHSQARATSKNLYQQRKKVFKLMIITGSIALIVISITVGLLIFNKETTSQSLFSQVGPTIKATVQQNTLIIKNEDGYFIDGVASKDIAKLTILESSKINPTYEYFGKLRELVYDDPHLHQLSLDPKLKLDTLVVRSSIMAVFSYSSTELKNLFLIDNPYMSEFSSSNIPQLTNFSITNTRLNTWTNNTFGKIAYVEVLDNPSFQFPNIAAIEISLLNIVNSEVVNYRDTFQSVPIKNLTLQNSYIDFDFTNNNFIQSILYISGASISFKIKNCPALHNITLVNTTQINLISIDNCLKLSQFKVNFTSVKFLRINGTNVTTFHNQTAPLLNYLFVLNTPLLSTTHQSLLNANALKELHIDYQRIKTQKSFDLNYQYLSVLHIFNYHFDSPLNTTHLPAIDNLTLNNASLPHIILNSKYLNAFVLTDVTIQNFTTESIFSQSLLSVAFSGLNIKQIVNLNLPKLASFRISNCPLLKSITGCNFNNLQQIYIVNCSQLERIQGNNFTSTVLTINNAPLLRWNQTYQNVQRFFVDNISSSQLTLVVNKYFSSIKFLHFQTEQSNQTVDFSNTLLKQFYLVCNNDCNLVNSSFPSTLFLFDFTNVVVLQSNRFRSLDNLYLAASPNFDSSALLQQLRLVKQDNVTLKVILIGLRVNQVSDAIKEIFPNAAVI